MTTQMTNRPAGTRTAPIGVRRMLSARRLDLAGHHQVFGALPALVGDRLVAMVEAAGLTGRGGAAFPAATKLRSVAGRARPVVVANASEGEPLSDKDACLVAKSPHLVLDGLVLAARAVGAKDAFVVLARRDLADAVRAAVSMRSDGIGVRVALAPDRFVSGEQSAVVDLLNGGPGLPLDKRVPTFERGVRNRPTLIHNVETLAQIALIARFGPEWFRAAGTDEEPGTMLATVSGAVRTPGVLEVPLGVSLRSVLDAAGAGPLRAVLVGGFHGAWVPGHELPCVSLSRASLQRFGAAPGAGVLMALGRDECGLQRAAGIASYLAGQSARQCGPCVNGLPRMADTLSRLARGDRQAGLVEEVARLQGLVRGRGACGHPDGTANFVRSSMSVFADEVPLHLAGGCSVSSPR